MEIERRRQEWSLSIREATPRKGQEPYRLKLADKDKILADLKVQVEELRRKSDRQWVFARRNARTGLDAGVRRFWVIDELTKARGSFRVKCKPLHFQTRRLAFWKMTGDDPHEIVNRIARLSRALAGGR